ncbi:hypothetical protein [Pseudogemmobacter sonorensis]|uniref:hypothetical protein n=1 Tax=Pseudogemmobacter sonorensis TaxID=2989681 RepID=UPI00368123C7
MAKQDDYTRYTIRLPTPLYERVKAAAGEASVNSLIVQVLEKEFPASEITHIALFTMLETMRSIEDNAERAKILRMFQDFLRACGPHITVTEDHDGEILLETPT